MADDRQLMADDGDDDGDEHGLITTADDVDCWPWLIVVPQYSGL